MRKSHKKKNKIFWSSSYNKEDYKGKEGLYDDEEDDDEYGQTPQPTEDNIVADETSEIEDGVGRSMLTKQNLN